MSSIDSPRISGFPGFSTDYLNTMWQYLPQGHEKPLKQAFFNTVANIFLLLGCGVFSAVYFVLSPFLRPLSWALLCGTFLYPFKRSLTNVIRNWLQGLDSSGTPFAVGLIILPFQIASRGAETITQLMLENLKAFIGVIFGIPVAYFLYSLEIHDTVLYIVQFLLAVLYDLTGFFNTLWIWTLFIAYFLCVMFMKQEYQQLLKKVSVPMWILMVVHLASMAGSMRVPLLLLLVAVLAVGFCVEVCQNKKPDIDPESPGTPLYLSVLYSVLGCGADTDKEKDSDGESEEQDITIVKDDIAEETEKTEKPESTPDPQPTPRPTTVMGSFRRTFAFEIKKDSSKTSNVSTQAVTQSPQARFPTPGRDPLISDTNHYIWGLIGAHLVVRLWMHFWIVLLLLFIPVIHAILKFLWTRFCADGKLKKLYEESRLALYIQDRIDLLMPRSLWGVLTLLQKGDSRIVRTLASGVDSATSVLFITMLLVGTLTFTLVAAIQIQTESMYMIKSTQELLNSTMNSEVSQWMPDADVMVNTMDQVVQKTHEYGRNFIASKVREYVVINKDEQDNLVNQLLEVWDRVYDAWKAKSSNSTGSDHHHQVLPDMNEMGSLWHAVSKGGSLFDINAIVAFLKENIGTFVSVLDSLWTVVRGNMNLILSIVTSVLSAVLGGGTAILNFVISAVIFLTTLFYLLSSSGDVYKPAEIFSSMSPGSNKFGNAVEEAISGVFMASLKMAAFYGLYTWLMHLVFGLNIVFIPSALAAILAAIPFLGPYWASVPAVIELWLVKGRGLTALLLFLAHMLPSSVVDAKFYGEIKGGHPYITGLAIAGGIYCMGLEGALIGPMILCGLIVFVNIYRTMLKNEPTTPASNVAWPTSRARKYGTRDFKEEFLSQSSQTDLLLLQPEEDGDFTKV